MKRAGYQVFKTAAPSKNDETGEICEDVICVTCNSNTNEETGEIEVHQKNIFKVPFQKSISDNERTKRLEELKCENCCRRGRRSLFLLIITLTMVLPSVGVFLYVIVESLLHQYAHTLSHKEKGTSFRNKLHRSVYYQFCAVCQSERSMDFIGKLQDERLAKMRKYMKNIPIQ